MAEQVSYDVIIVGGAMMGASVAWFLSSHPGFDGTIAVFERDPGYELCSTTHSNSCMRQQFTTAPNIPVSRFCADYVRNFRDHMGGGEDIPDLHVHPFGYMYLATTEEGAQVLRDAQALQAGLGAQTRLLSREALAEGFPFYRSDDVLLASYGPVDEGYFDGGTMFDTWRRKAKANGVTFLKGEVTAIAREGARITGVTLDDGTRLACGALVNATGPRAAHTAAMAGLDLPVEPRKRYTFVFDSAQSLGQDLPLTVDPSGVHVRTDGAGFMAGCPPRDGDPAVAPDDFTADHGLWEEVVWPALYERIPAFEAIRLRQMWVGHYAYNTLDQNALLGPHPEVPNFLLINGFSGHGLQQSPAMGRGLAEWIVSGRFETLDLSAFAYDRIAKGALIVERAII
ncbi:MULTISPECIES: NAD(P)/FAD-dependent oxidoreductase [Paracoccaceae]|nr:FAD-binding oxidoreductase [Marinibacterium profundimaris]